MKKVYITPRIEALDIGTTESLLLGASDSLTTEESFARDIIYIDMISDDM